MKTVIAFVNHTYLKKLINQRFTKYNSLNLNEKHTNKVSYCEIKSHNFILLEVNSHKILNLTNFGFHVILQFNPCPAEPGYTLSLQTV